MDKNENKTKTGEGVCVWTDRRVSVRGAGPHISSEMAAKRHGAYLDDKQHGRDLSAAEQIRRKRQRGRVKTTVVWWWWWWRGGAHAQ